MSHQWYWAYGVTPNLKYLRWVPEINVTSMMLVLWRNTKPKTLEIGIEDQCHINDVGLMAKHQTINTWDRYRRSMSHQWCWAYGETPNLKHLRWVSKINVTSMMLGLWWKARDLNHSAANTCLFWCECHCEQIYFMNLFRYLPDNFSQLELFSFLCYALKIYKGTTI